MTYTYTEDSYKVPLARHTSSECEHCTKVDQGLLGIRLGWSQSRPQHSRSRLSALCAADVHVRGIPVGSQHSRILSSALSANTFHLGQIW